MSENINEKVDPRFATKEELEELCLNELNEMLEEPKTIEKSVDPDAIKVKEECDCDCGDLLSFGFDGDYGDLLALLYGYEEDYINSKIAYEKQEAHLWLNTNWDEAFPDKKPTQKDKEMYVKEGLRLFKFIRDSNKAKYDHFKRMFDLSLKYSLEVLR